MNEMLNDKNKINDLLSEYQKIKEMLVQQKNVSFLVAKKIIEYLYR
jgi:hypothetical protein